MRPFTLDVCKFITMRTFTKIDGNTVQRDHLQQIDVNTV